MTPNEAIKDNPRPDTPSTDAVLDSGRGTARPLMVAALHVEDESGDVESTTSQVSRSARNGKDAVASEQGARGNRDHHIIPDSELMQYPWSCIGRVEAAPKGSSDYQGVGTGTLVAPNMVLTASHILEVRLLAEWSYRFVPAYKGGPQPKDPTGGLQVSANFTGRFITGNPSGNPAAGGVSNNVNGWDFVICELHKPLGDYWGHLGVRSGGKESLYQAHRWFSVGYPQGLGGSNPIRFPGIDIQDVDDDKYNTKEIETDDYVFEDFFPGGHTFSPGWSGGPLLGVVEGAWWVVGVMSGREPDGVFDLINGVNVFAGGRRLIDVHQKAHLDWFPSRALVPGWAHVAPVSRSTDRLDLFVTDVKGKIRTASWEPSFSDGWRGWREINGGRAGDGAPLHAVARSQDKLDVFVVSSDSKAYTAAWEPAFTDGWHGWWDINGGQAPGGRITAVSRGKDKLDVFVAGSDGRIWTAAWDPRVSNEWQGWWPIGDVRVPHGAYIHAVSRTTPTSSTSL